MRRVRNFETGPEGPELEDLQVEKKSKAAQTRPKKLIRRTCPSGHGSVVSGPKWHAPPCSESATQKKSFRPQRKNFASACKKFWGIPVRNATKTPPSVCKKTPSVCTEPPLYGNSREFPKKGRFRAGNSNGNSGDSRPREFPLWEFQVTTSLFSCT